MEQYRNANEVGDFIREYVVQIVVSTLLINCFCVVRWRHHIQSVECGPRFLSLYILINSLCIGFVFIWSITYDVCASCVFLSLT